MIRRLLFLPALLLILIGTALFGQENKSLYYDYAFNDYIKLEAEILDKYEKDALEGWDLGVIEKFRTEVELLNREDINSRLDMLDFIVNSQIEKRLTEDSAVEAVSSITEAEKDYRSSLNAGKALKTGAVAAIGTAAAAGIIYAASALLAVEFHESYAETEDAYNAQFYIFWSETLNNVAFGAAITALSAGTAAGICAALF